MIILIIRSIITWVSQEIIYTDELYIKSLSENINHFTIEKVLGIQGRFDWVTYIFTPLTLLLKLTFSTICIKIGLLLTHVKQSYYRVFKVTILAEGVFIIAQIIFVIILYINLDLVTLQNSLGFYPLSALNLIGIDNINAQWAIFPLQTVNMFQLFYVIVIAWLLSRQLEQDFVESLNIVLPSYGLGLLLWVTLVAFLTLQLS